MAASLKRCDSCHRDMSKSATIYCYKCDKSFDKAAVVSDGLSGTVKCPECKSSSDVSEMPDETGLLCKYCLDEATTDSPTSLPVIKDRLTLSLPKPPSLAPSVHRTWSLPEREVSSDELDSLLGLCHCCSLKYVIADDAALCPLCHQQADGFETAQHARTSEELNAQTSSLKLVGDCLGHGHVASSNALGRTSDYANELWRFVPCICHNNQPDCFEVRKSGSSTRSFYCLTCQQPYGKTVFKQELSGDKCPKCNSNQVVADSISHQEEVVVCLFCESEVSKRRIDNHCAQVQSEVLDEFEGAEQVGGPESCCKNCGVAGAEVEVKMHMGGLWLVQVCVKCSSNEMICEIDAEQTFEEQPAMKLQNSVDAVPEGFEELAQCCGLAQLHPVADDPDDNLLVCSCSRARCINLSECRSSKIPKTVPELRIALPAYSSGAMGQPFQTVRVQDTASLKPGDHLEFDRKYYSHHAIVVDVLLKEQKVAVAEYTGELDGQTAKAAISLSAKGQVAWTLLPFQDIVQSARVVVYRNLDCFSPTVVVRRALNRLGEKDYHVGTQNCEHFSCWAKTGLSVSRQVDLFKNNAKKALENPLIDEILGKVAALGAGKKSVKIGVDVVQDLRNELLQLVSLKQGASGQFLKCMLRLGIKWGIRGLPVLLTLLTRNLKVLPYLSMLDAKLVKPAAESLVQWMLPIEDKPDDKTKDKTDGKK